MSVEANFRELTDRERAVLMRLPEPSFPGRDALLAQATSISGEDVGCGNGCVALRSESNVVATVTASAPVEASFVDEDDEEAVVLLIVRSGLLSELHFYKRATASLVQSIPDVGALQVTVNESEAK